ncbi:hypothetical protein H2O64_07280 [Kordia sp. YSTF-M3]|uniref:Uncharacterized protein n=1 Tax=Kordia aestuariivivens TaxID=2759037 RepID=A0ABR7Q7D7_9FLAO|nr:hypothetical protein [Kordia aestuariivivens]MBC8754469.1 hypothetical protein [Kordia aestuariivivens]
MKRIKMYLGMLMVAALTITSCQTDSVSETPEEQTSFEATKRTAQENVTTVTHNYNYNGERFSVSYALDNDSGEVLSMSGDTSRAQSLVSDDNEPQAVLFSNLQDRGDGTDLSADAIAPSNVEIDVMLFDTVEEMEAVVERSAGSAIPNDEGTALATGAEGPCISFSGSGTGNFYYYKHAYYNTEMTGLRRTSRRYFWNHWVGSSYNDQMSSLIVTKPYNRRAYTILYEHSCFNGRAIGFYQGTGAWGFGVANLKWYRLRWWRSWNDQVSSIRGYAW